MCIRKDFPTGGLKEVFHELASPSDTSDKTITKREATQTVWVRFEEQVGDGVASREWGEDRQEMVASTCP